MSGARFGLISDVHGNLHALEAVLARLRSEGVDEVVCAGDLVGWGPQPNEVVALIAESGILSVAGNHDLMAIGALEARSDRIRENVAWTREALAPATSHHLASLPKRLDLGEVVVAHGSVDDPERYVHRESQADSQLATLTARWSHARVLVLGHTHRQWLYGRASGSSSMGGLRPLPRGETLLVNPGSVGQSRQREFTPRARFAILDLASGDLNLLAVEYDVAACRRLVHAQGLPRRAIHDPPRRMRRRLAKLHRRLVAARQRW